MALQRELAQVADDEVHTVGAKRVGVVASSNAVRRRRERPTCRGAGPPRVSVRLRDQEGSGTSRATTWAATAARVAVQLTVEEAEPVASVKRTTAIAMPQIRPRRSSPEHRPATTGGAPTSDRDSGPMTDTRAG